MEILEICETPDCNKEAEHITSTESKFIQVCRDCYCKIYKR